MNVYQYHWLPTKKEAFICSACLELFLACSGLLYGLFRVVLFFTSDNVTECFELQKLHADFIQRGTIIANVWLNVWKLVEYRKQMRQTGEGNRFWLSTLWLTFDFHGERQKTPRNFFCRNQEKGEIINPPKAFLCDL